MDLNVICLTLASPMYIQCVYNAIVDTPHAPHTPRHTHRIYEYKCTLIHFAKAFSFTLWKSSGKTESIYWLDVAVTVAVAVVVLCRWRASAAVWCEQSRECERERKRERVLLACLQFLLYPTLMSLLTFASCFYLWFYIEIKRSQTKPSYISPISVRSLSLLLSLLLSSSSLPFIRLNDSLSGGQNISRQINFCHDGDIK